MTHEASTFDLLPAIDLRGGRVVRLQQGSFDREQVYGDDPAAVAAGFRSAGSSWIHVVDLDGARTGTRSHDPATASIVEAATSGATDGRPAMSVQVAGGFRDASTVARALDAGAARVVLGTAALQNPDLVAELVRRHGRDRIAAALDVRDGLAVGDGWLPGAAGRTVGEAIRTLNDAGIATFVVTAIARDGLLGGPDVELLASVVGAVNGDVIASGGVASIDDLLQVRALGCRGAIVGRALYDGRIDLSEALEAISPTGPRPGPSSSR